MVNPGMPDPNKYRVIVPYEEDGELVAVSYPPKGDPLYTRREAMFMLLAMDAEDRRPLPWAESENGTRKFNLKTLGMMEGDEE